MLSPSHGVCYGTQNQSSSMGSENLQEHQRATEPQEMGSTEHDQHPQAWDDVKRKHDHEMAHDAPKEGLSVSQGEDLSYSQWHETRKAQPFEHLLRTLVAEHCMRRTLAVVEQILGVGLSRLLGRYLSHFWEHDSHGVENVVWCLQTSPSTRWVDTGRTTIRITLRAVYTELWLANERSVIFHNSVGLGCEHLMRCTTVGVNL